MGLLDGILGSASSVPTQQVADELGKLLGPDERVELAYRLIRDMIILTDRRVILIDKQGVTGRKTEYHSIPYRAITHFSVESAGHFDLEADLKIWISGLSEPVEKAFGRGVDVYQLQAMLARFIAR